jgi:hypothetical protein
MRAFLAVIFSLAGLSLFCYFYVMRVAPGAREQLNTLLNQPAMVQPAGITPLGKSWFRLETDAHVITDEAGFEQVAAVLIDLKNTTHIFNGKKSKLSGHIISQGADETIVDFVMISILPMGIHIKTPYRASVKNTEKNETKAIIEIWQLASDSSSNKDIKNLFSVRYAEEITIAGKKYTYIRVYAIDDVNTSILPGARGILENSSATPNIEALQLIIAAAKTR